MNRFATIHPREGAPDACGPVAAPPAQITHVFAPPVYRDDHGAGCHYHVCACGLDVCTQQGDTPEAAYVYIWNAGEQEQFFDPTCPLAKP